MTITDLHNRAINFVSYDVMAILTNVSFCRIMSSRPVGSPPHIRGFRDSVRMGKSLFGVKKSVVIAQLSDEQCISINLIDHSMLICDAPGPVPSQAMFQWLRLTNTFKGCPLALLDEQIDALEDFPVSALPI
jgi:hypothetical protein